MTDNYREDNGSDMKDESQVTYDDAFDGDQKVDAFLKLTSEAFTRRYERIKIKDIGYSNPVKEGRRETIRGLSETIAGLGVVNPVHVMQLETTPDDDDDEDAFKYVLLDGLRRIYGAQKNRQTDIDAIIWDFKDKDQGSDLALFISLLLNKKQTRKWGEIWHLYTVLELQSSITPGTLEYLLELERGDAMRLKDVMLCDYEEVKRGLLSGEKNLDASYKALQKARKEEDDIEREDATGLSHLVEGAQELEAEERVTKLSDQDTLELLDMARNIDDMSDMTEEDFNTLNQGIDEQQKVGERHPLDPALKSAVLKRDDFKCQCCGFGGAAALGVLAVHHVLPVHVGGKDNLENLTTLCLNHHLLLHIAERNGGKLQMTQEEFKEYPEPEQRAIKKTLNLARVAVEAAKRKGMSNAEVRSATEKSVRHPMPGAGLPANQQAYNESKLEHKDK